MSDPVLLSNSGPACQGRVESPRTGQDIVVVSGLPRSGTSMAMAMLAAGGLPVLDDGSRPADPHNPGGYYEYAPVRASRSDTSWVARAPGKAVKVVAALLPWLPPDQRYRVIFMVRDVLETAVSQRRMLEGGPAEATAEDRRFARLLAAHLREVSAWLRSAGHMDTLWVSHRAVLRDPLRQAARMAAYAGGPLDADRMAAAVRPGWWRARRYIRENFLQCCNKDLFLDTIPRTDLAVRSADAGTRDVPASAADSPGSPSRRVNRIRLLRHE
ncbi:MAG TPA: hypothetical protein PLO53_02540 [Candidatus Hydrogenedentes bacterium]|nr:hypothetical protein [Candidatus Hydrogenedentota bacterium]